MIDPKFLQILACPKCPSRPKVELTDGWLVCPVCHSKYPIRDGFPQLLIEEAISPEPTKETPL
jgi:uncharacterized protein YbaR (Trm112 family)